MSNDVVHMTQEGLDKLKEEYAMRTGQKRQEIADRLQEAIKMGDLKENADYQVAKEDQAFNEGRVQDIEETFRNVKLIEANHRTDRVTIGATVTLCEVGYDDEEEQYRIVGPEEADPVSGLISNVSPIGRALLGAKIGEVVRAATPGGTLEFKILKIS